MQDITLEQMEAILTDEAESEGALEPEQAQQFLSALSASLDREIAEHSSNPAEVALSLESEQSGLWLGLVPEDDLVAATTTSTGLPAWQVRRFVEKLGKLILRSGLMPDRRTPSQTTPVHAVRQNDAVGTLETLAGPQVHEEVLGLDGFGTFEIREGRKVFRPDAFAYYMRS